MPKWNDVETLISTDFFGYENRVNLLSYLWKLKPCLSSRKFTPGLILKRLWKVPATSAILSLKMAKPVASTVALNWSWAKNRQVGYCIIYNLYSMTVLYGIMFELDFRLMWEYTKSDDQVEHAAEYWSAWFILTFFFQVKDLKHSVYNKQWNHFAYL